MDKLLLLEITKLSYKIISNLVTYILTDVGGENLENHL